MDSRPMNNDPEISVVIPIYRGDQKIRLLIKEVRQMFTKIAGSSFEIILVDDGSDDNTLSVLEQEKNSDTFIISYRPNKGKGYAVRQGILMSRGRNVIYIDADMDILPVSMQEFIHGLETHDLVIGSKAHPMSKVDCHMSRRLISIAFNMLVRKTTGIKIKDTQAGLKAGRGEILRIIFNAMAVNGYAFDVEFLCLADLLNLSLMEAPIKINYTRSFKLSNCLKMLVELFWISYRLKINRSYHKKLTAITLTH